MSFRPLSRRDFWKQTLAVGGLISASALPLTGCHSARFPKRGRFERLSLAYHQIFCGATRPFSILHLSDTHLTSAYRGEPEYTRRMSSLRTEAFGGRQEESLRDSLDWARTHVDYVLHTGDLIDFQSRANFDLVRHYFGDSATALGCVGNHEYLPDWWSVKETHDEAFRARSRPKVAAAFPFDIDFHAQTINGVNFIAMDNIYGTVTPAQAKRFRREVAKKLPIVLAVHCPFWSEAIGRADKKFWSDRKLTVWSPTLAPYGDFRRQQSDQTTVDFIRELKQEPLLKGILAGHLHIQISDRFSPTAVQYVVGANFLYHGQEIIFS